MNRPYYPISEFYKSRFGEKVYKIPVSTAQTCPNREGIRGMKTCNFCDVWGSAAYPELRERQLREQILMTQESLAKAHRAQKFLVYFQAYTNTFQKTHQLQNQIEVAKALPGIAGIVVGTRPDCLSEVLFEYLQATAHQMYVGVELGVQSFDEGALVWMRRGHTAERSIAACWQFHDRSRDVDLGIHLMFGWPGETLDHVIEAARLTNQLPISNVKLHNLHVLHQTPLEEEYQRGQFTPISLNTYAKRVAIYLQHLNPKIAVHRLAALSRRPEELVAPEWTAQKMAVHQAIVDFMNRKKCYQGQLYLIPRGSAHLNALRSPFAAPKLEPELSCHAENPQNPEARV